nr:hypothetical protein [Tanacetum cinerariifolium]
MIKFVKEANCPRVIKTNKTENARKSTVKYAKMYRNISKGKTWPKNNYAHKSMTPRAILLKPGTTPIVGNPHNNIDNKGYWDSGCSRHMTGNISYLSEYEPYDGGYVSFGHGGEKIIDFKLKYDTNVLLRTPRQHNMYSIDLNNIVPHKNLTCLVAKALLDENHLGKFDAKGDEGYFVGYSLSSKAFRVFNKRTKKVEENLHVDFLENKLIEK